MQRLKVAELIEMLQQQDAGAEVVFADSNDWQENKVRGFNFCGDAFQIIELRANADMPEEPKTELAQKIVGDRKIVLVHITEDNEPI